METKSNIFFCAGVFAPRFSHCFVRNRRYALFPGGAIMDKLTEANIG